jgi:hypothetical protein
MHCVEFITNRNNERSWLFVLKVLNKILAIDHIVYLEFIVMIVN